MIQLLVTGVGKHLIRIQGEDTQGKKAQAELQLEVIDDAPRSALGTVEIELVALPEAPACAEELCVRARTRLASLQLDELHVAARGSDEALLELREPALDQDSRELGCAPLMPNVDLRESTHFFTASCKSVKQAR